MPIGEDLVAKGLITADQLAEATAKRTSPSERMDQVLIREGYVTERAVLDVFSEQLRIPVIELKEADIDRELLKLIPSRLVHRYGLMPITKNGKGVRIATSDPYNMYALDEVRTCINMPVEPILAPRTEIQKLIRAFYGVGGEVLQEMVDEKGDLEIIDEKKVESDDLDVQLAQEASVIKLVNEILSEAISQRASDIHYEPFENDFRVRYRIDGVLEVANVPPEIRRFQNAIISRIKILSNLNIAERRLPQDGGFKIKAHGREIDLRVSVIPMAFGEGIVLRILDRTSVKLDLHMLGMEGPTYDTFHDLITRPHGIMLVTGPTGSGKTTTLYAALLSIVSAELKILTIEDPVEYYLEGVNQTHVIPKIGLTFARALRSFLRHDPDVILVGEIRDKETAEVAINASLTGHLVFSTLHTNDAVTATTRLLDMGVEPFLVASSLEGVLGQRLVRTVCPYCAEPYTPPEKALAAWAFEDLQHATFMRGKGCYQCMNTGYKGRTGIFEVLVNDEMVHEMILKRKSAQEITREATLAGRLRTLQNDARDKVVRGLTTLEEAASAVMV